MITVIKYITIAILLLLAELVYFRIADHFNIIDKPNLRSSHTEIVLRGGGIIFLIGSWVWSAFFGFQYPWFLAAVTLAAAAMTTTSVREQAVKPWPTMPAAATAKKDRGGTTTVPPLSCFELS